MADMMAMLQTIVSRLDGLDAKMANLQMGGGADEGGGGGAELPKSIKAFDEYVRETVDPFVAAGKVLLHKPTHSRHTHTHTHTHANFPSHDYSIPHLRLVPPVVSHTH